jgi:hypothetical protein
MIAESNGGHVHTSEEPPEPAAVPWAPLAQFRTRALGEISFASAAEFLSAAEPAPHEQATVPVARFGSAL